MTAGNLDDTAVFPVDDKNGNTRKATIAQLRTQIAAAAIAFLSTVSFASTLSSVTPVATPGALGATSAYSFASTVSGHAIMGYGTTNDVTLMNRAGTPVIGITANTTAVTMAGTLNGQTISSAANFTGTLGVTGTAAFNAAATSWVATTTHGKAIFQDYASGTGISAQNTAGNADGAFTIGGYSTVSYLAFAAGGAAVFSSTLAVTGALNTLATLGVGTTADSQWGMVLANTALTGTDQMGVRIRSTFTSASTSSATSLYIGFLSAAAAYNITNAYGLFVETGSKGGGSTVTNAYGIYINNQTMGGTLNIGLYNAGTTTLVGTLTSNAITAGGLITASAGVTVAAGQALTLGNAYVAGVQVPSGYVVIKDSAGTSYKVSVNL